MKKKIVSPNRLTYERQIQMNNEGKQLCPYLRNPIEDNGIYGQCALTEDMRPCTGPSLIERTLNDVSAIDCDNIRRYYETKRLL
jgi:hypothetical protein